VTRSCPLAPSALAATRQAHAGALTQHHPSFLILEVTILDQQTALANLPEEPDPVTLPALLGCFFQVDDMDTEAKGDPPVLPSPTAAAAIPDASLDAMPLNTEVATPVTEPQGTLFPTAMETRKAALTVFLAAPRLRDPTKAQLGGISVLICFLLDPAECRGALSRIAPCIPNTEAERVWEAWSSHLEHETAPTPHGATARTLLLDILISSLANAGEHAEVETLLHLYITDTIKDSTLRAHTIGAPQDEPMPQSSSKRGRDETCDTEDTATYHG